MKEKNDFFKKTEVRSKKSEYFYLVNLVNPV